MRRLLCRRAAALRRPRNVSRAIQPLARRHGPVVSVRGCFSPTMGSRAQRRLRALGGQLSARQPPAGAAPPAALPQPHPSSGVAPSVNTAVRRRDPLSPLQADTFERDGFVNAGALLTEPELSSLSASLDTVLTAGPEAFEHAPEFQRPVSYTPFFGSGCQIVNLFEASDAFRELLYHPKIVAVVQQLMGCDELFVWCALPASWLIDLASLLRTCVRH